MLLGLSGIVTVGLTALEQNPEHVAAFRWADEHKPSLPSTVTEIAAYPPAYRAAIMASLPDHLRYRVIYQHIGDVLTNRKDLNVEQRAYMSATRDKIDAYLAGKLKPGVPDPKVCEFERALFPNQMRKEIGDPKNIGDYSDATQTLSSRIVWMTERIRRAGAAWVVHARGARECNCHFGSGGYCNCYPGQCTNEAGPCNPLTDPNGVPYKMCTQNGWCGCTWCGTNVVCDAVCIPPI